MILLLSAYVIFQKLIFLITVQPLCLYIAYLDKTSHYYYLLFNVENKIYLISNVVRKFLEQ